MNFRAVRKIIMESRRRDNDIHFIKTRTHLIRQRDHPALINANDKWTRHHPADPAQEMASAFTTAEAIAEPPRVP